MKAKRKKSTKIVGIDEELVVAIAETAILDPDRIDNLVYQRIAAGQSDPLPDDATTALRRRIVRRVQRLVDDRNNRVGAELRRRILREALDRALRASVDAAVSIEAAASSVRSGIDEFRRDRELAMRCFVDLGATKSQTKQFAKLLRDDVSEQIHAMRRGLGVRLSEAIDRDHRRASELAERLFGDEL